MKQFVSLILLIGVGLSGLNRLTAQSPQDQEVIRVRTNEVRLDIVVKDKKGGR
jgi:hypothetical protein